MRLRRPTLIVEKMPQEMAVTIQVMGLTLGVRPVAKTRLLVEALEYQKKLPSTLSPTIAENGGACL